MVQFHTTYLNDVELEYGEVAGPEPALVILHGLTGSSAEFMHLVPDVAQHAHLYLLDLRGHGRSGWAVDGAYQIADYGRDVIAFLQEVVGRPAILWGHSLGGAVAAWVTAQQPALVTGLILEDPALYVLQQERFRDTWFYSYFAALYSHLLEYQAQDPTLADRVAYVGHAPMGDGQTWLDVAGAEAVAERALQLHQLDPAVLAPIFADGILGDEAPNDLLAQLRCPVQLVVAYSANGGTLTAPEMQRALTQMPHAAYAWIDHAGHDIHLDQPQALLREIRPFITAIRRGATTQASLLVGEIG